MEEININKIKEIKCVIRNVVCNREGIDSDEFKGLVKILLEYTDEIEKQLGIEKTVNGMKSNDIQTLINTLSRAESKIVALENKLNNSEINTLENRKMELENDIKNKIYKINKYNKAIRKIEEIIAVEIEEKDLEDYDY